MQRLITLVFLASFVPLAQAGDHAYRLGEASLRHEGVPQGKVIEHVWKSGIFPGTVRRYWVYVPAPYDGSQPVDVMVFQDGQLPTYQEMLFIK